MQKTIKRTAMVTLLMGVVQFGGCGLFNLERLARDFVSYAAFEFLLDNDASPANLDLFEDGTTGLANP